MHAEDKSDEATMHEAATSKYFSRGPYLRQFIQELDSVNEDAQASQGDIGLDKFVAATVACNKDILSRDRQLKSLLNMHGANGKCAH
eukprot:scaffold35030_cov74-Phaeocystis_antarctica.AAC.1